MTNIVALLRYGTQQRNHGSLVELCAQAADRIEQLEAELRVVLLYVADLRAADPHHGLGRDGVK